MIETIISAAKTATIGGATAATAKTAVQIERDENGNAVNMYVNKKRATTAFGLSSTATSATYGGQEASYQQTINELNNAQAYVHSMSDEELEQTLIALGE